MADVAGGVSDTNMFLVYGRYNVIVTAMRLPPAQVDSGTPQLCKNYYYLTFFNFTTLTMPMKMYTAASRNSTV